MPSIFISYRREDTSGEAGHLASELRSRFGGKRVFMDVDAIAPGADFEERIDNALTTCQVTFVLIGDRWLSSKLPDGTRRLDDEHDYVRREIAAALARRDVTVVPVLVEGAKMPAASELPESITSLAKRNAFELSNKRWRFDLNQLCRVIRRHGRWWVRLLSGRRHWMKRGAPLAIVPIGAVAAVVAFGGGSSRPNNRTVLVPATVPPAVDECTTQLTTAVDGTVGPLKCQGDKLNTLAWQYYAKFNPQIMALGRYATEGQVQSTICFDGKHSATTIPQETEAYQMAALYYGWQFTLPPDPATMSC